MGLIFGKRNDGIMELWNTELIEYWEDAKWITRDAIMLTVVI